MVQRMDSRYTALIVLIAAVGALYLHVHGTLIPAAALILETPQASQQVDQQGYDYVESPTDYNDVLDGQGLVNI